MTACRTHTGPRANGTFLHAASGLGIHGTAARTNVKEPQERAVYGPVLSCLGEPAGLRAAPAAPAWCTEDGLRRYRAHSSPLEVEGRRSGPAVWNRHSRPRHHRMSGYTARRPSYLRE